MITTCGLHGLNVPSSNSVRLKNPQNNGLSFPANFQYDPYSIPVSSAASVVLWKNGKITICATPLYVNFKSLPFATGARIFQPLPRSCSV